MVFIPLSAKLSDKDQVSLQFRYMSDVPQLQCRAIREADHHIAIPNNVTWFIISQVHLPKSTFHIVLKDILLGMV